MIDVFQPLWLQSLYLLINSKFKNSNIFYDQVFISSCKYLILNLMFCANNILIGNFRKVKDEACTGIV